MKRNAFPGQCNGCKSKVGAHQGYRQPPPVGERKFIVWCKDCCPERKIPTVRRLTAEGVILWPYDGEELDLVRAFPGARFIGNDSAGWSAPIPDYTEGYWVCSLVVGDRSRVLELADRLKLDVAPSLREVQQSQQAEIAEDSGLYDFQVTGVDFLVKKTKALLGDDMGLGKTIQTLMALPRDEPALAVVPACVKYNWQDECLKWRKDLTPVVLCGRGSFRLPEPGELILVNYELLPQWLEGKKPDGAKWINYDHFTPEQRDELSQVNLIVDEAHKVKNYKTQRAKRVTGLSANARRSWALTGTPLFNRPMDLWGTLSALGFQREVFKGFLHFLECFNGFKGAYGGYTFGSTCQPIVPELLRRVMLRRLRTEVLPDLPTKTYTTLVVDIEGKRLKNKMDRLLGSLGDYNVIQDAGDHFYDDDHEATARHRLPPFEAFSEIRADLANNRIKAVLEYAEDCEEQDVPLIVFSAHVDPIKALAEREGWKCITGETPARKRQELVRAFQAGELKGLACTIIAAGVGLTLTHAWKCLFVDLDWVPANNWQAEDRICRIGQKSGVCEIVRMVSNHVLEQHVHLLLAAKIAMIQAAIEATIKVDPKAVEEDGETEEDYKARMDRVSFLKAEQAGLSKADRDAEIAAYVDWFDNPPEAEADDEILF